MTKLQMAVDPLSMAEALKLAERVQDVVDILEVGTPMIVRDGLHPVTAIRKSCPSLTVLADTKIAPFRLVRIGTDLVCVILGTLMGARPGVGTIVTALCMGPLIDFFNRKVARPFLERAGR